MIDIVYEILKEVGIPIQHILRPNLEEFNIGISYHFFNESYDVYGDGIGTQMSGILQIDLFSTKDYSKEVKEIRDLLVLNNFKLADMRDSDDVFSDIQYYHKIMIFNYNEQEVMRQWKLK